MKRPADCTKKQYCLSIIKGKFKIQQILITQAPINLSHFSFLFTAQVSGVLLLHYQSINLQIGQYANHSAS